MTKHNSTYIKDGVSFSNDSFVLKSVTFAKPPNVSTNFKKITVKLLNELDTRATTFGWSENSINLS